MATTQQFISESLEDAKIHGTFGSTELLLESDSIFGTSGSVDDDEKPVLVNPNPVTDPIKAVSGFIDPRIGLLSYSSRKTLKLCARRYQLDKLRAPKGAEPEEDSVTFSFGHVVGEGIQLVLQDVPMKKIIWKMFLGWTANLFARDVKRKKSFSEAVFAVRRFAALRAAGFLNDLELVYVNGTPACELGFVVDIFDNFRYRGFVDAVFRNRKTGEIIVLECKTTWYKDTNPAQFKNSGQALGYSIVLDALFPGLSSYSVLYLVYSTTSFEFTPLPFEKSFEQRAEWIKSLVFDVEEVMKYEEEGIYPKNGEGCFAFFKECRYIATCSMSTAYLAKPFNQESKEEMERDEARYTYKISLVDLIKYQVARNEEMRG